MWRFWHTFPGNAEDTRRQLDEICMKNEDTSTIEIAEAISIACQAAYENGFRCVCNWLVSPIKWFWVIVSVCSKKSNPRFAAWQAALASGWRRACVHMYMCTCRCSKGSTRICMCHGCTCVCVYACVCVSLCVSTNILYVIPVGVVLISVCQRQRYCVRWAWKDDSSGNSRFFTTRYGTGCRRRQGLRSSCHSFVCACMLLQRRHSQSKGNNLTTNVLT